MIYNEWIDEHLPKKIKNMQSGADSSDQHDELKQLPLELKKSLLSVQGERKSFYIAIEGFRRSGHRTFINQIISFLRSCKFIKRVTMIDDLQEDRENTLFVIDNENLISHSQFSRKLHRLSLNARFRNCAIIITSQTRLPSRHRYHLTHHIYHTGQKWTVKQHEE